MSELVIEFYHLMVFQFYHFLWMQNYRLHKIAIIRKVVKKVSVIRLSKYIAQISVFNHLNNTVTVYEANSNKQSKEMGVKVIDEYHQKEKKTS